MPLAAATSEQIRSSFFLLIFVTITPQARAQNIPIREGPVTSILIMLVLIALVLIFKEQITKILKTLMSKVSSESSGV